MLAKQGRKSESDEVKKFMEESQNRIQSMAMVHQQLYQTRDFERIKLTGYTQVLLNHIASYYHVANQQIEIEVDVVDQYFPVDVAIPYGLILNELVSNCFKYGFAERRKGKLVVKVCELKDHVFQLYVSDDGNGLPEDMDHRTEKSLGLDLVKGIAWQLRGTLTYRNAHPGSVFEVTFVNNLQTLRS